jgi:acetolactate decarboxylase
MFKYLFFSMAVLLMQNAFAQNPSIKVLDTDFSKGRLAHQQTITLDDAAKFHGHLCDGLVVGFLGLREALYKIYPDSIIDRTNTRIVSKSSPCLTDIAIYLTGGRYQFNTYYVSDSIKYAFIVQRIDNGKAYAVKLKPGIKPAAIDSLGNLANIGKLDACGIDSLHQNESRFLNQLLVTNPQEAFILEEIKNYAWNPIISNSFLKTDIVNKNLQNCLPVKN